MSRPSKKRHALPTGHSPSAQSVSPQRHALHVATFEYNGPLPPPEILRRFEDILPGTAERILRQFEVEAEHRRSCEQAMIESEIQRQAEEAKAYWRGQWFGFLIGCLALSLGTVLAIMAHDWAGKIAGGLIGGGGVAGLVGIFVLGRRYEASEAAGRETPADEAGRDTQIAKTTHS